MNWLQLEKAGNLCYLSAGSTVSGVLLVSIASNNVTFGFVTEVTVAMTGFLMLILGLALCFWSVYLTVNNYFSSIDGK